MRVGLSDGAGTYPPRRETRPTSRRAGVAPGEPPVGKSAESLRVVAHPKTNHENVNSYSRLFFLATAVLRAADSSDKLQYGAWGFDLDGADTSTKPGDDFFRYANGKWLDKTQIPPTNRRTRCGWR